MYLAWEALSKFVPDLYIGVLPTSVYYWDYSPVAERRSCIYLFFVDTMGYAFTFHVVAWVAGTPIGAYVHYPTISTDMLARVEARRTTYANSKAITSSTFLSRLKLQ